ncbi:MAG: hypothetical protein OEZ58_12990 [Gammaproteobacteria bacterium]|nr:hypothetical protein [Gammaproteobacteria bacterium]MDH5729904.1 hypothetical protein [Gammaproteobacteria bacterium]
MLHKVSYYCQSILSRIIPTGQNQSSMSLPLKHDYKNTISIYGTIIYNIEHRGYFGILSDCGKQFFPINGGNFTKILKHHRRVQATVIRFPEVASFYRWGEPVQLINAEIID